MPSNDPAELRRGLRDLVALSILPTLWNSSSPQAIAESLSEVLLNLLRLDVVYIQLRNAALEIARTSKQLLSSTQAHYLGECFAPYLTSKNANLTLTVTDPLRDGDLQIAVIPIGLYATEGYIVAGAYASAALSEIDRLVLGVAANQAVTALQQAALMDDLRAAYENERAARSEADIANQTKMRFLAMISHELRTPLTSIKGFASTMQSDDIDFSPQDQREFLRIIEGEANKITELIDQLLDLSRLQAGAMRITPESLSAATLIELIRPRLLMLTPDHTLVIDVPHPPPILHVDSSRIGQVLSNLVHNAVKFSPPHSQITVRVVPQPHQVQIDVQDQGAGIPAEQRDKLFELFKQADHESHAHQGTGLGLAICKGLVEAHGGRIWIQDTTPGTTISFTLPTLARTNV